MGRRVTLAAKLFFHEMQKQINTFMKSRYHKSPVEFYNVYKILHNNISPKTYREVSGVSNYTRNEK